MGAGTGLFSNALVSNDVQVIATDVSQSLVSHASGERVAARAEALPFASSTYDVVIAAQCWHWLDRTRAPVEIRRVLKPGGALAVVYQTYIPLPGSIAEATEKLILRHQPHWRHANSTGINGQVLRDIQIAGFAQIETFSFDVAVAFTRESWAGFVRTTSPLAAMDSATLEAFERAHEEILCRAPQGFEIPHRVFAVVTRRPAGL